MTRQNEDRVNKRLKAVTEKYDAELAKRDEIIDAQMKQIVLLKRNEQALLRVMRMLVERTGG